MIYALPVTHPKWREEALGRWHAHAVALKKDKLLGPVVRAVGPPDLNTPGKPFHSLARAITSQQISVKAAATIYARLLELVGGERKLTPVNVLGLDVEQLRGVGYSRQKVGYLIALAQHASDGRLPVGRLHQMPDEEVQARLVDVPGIGEWSAHMFMMFYLAREDIWPIGDLGLREAVGRLYGQERPTPGACKPLGDPWAGRRSVATWYLWRSLEGEGNGGGIW